MGDARVVVGLLQEIFLKHTYEVEASILVQETDKSKIKETAIENAKSGIWRTVEEGEGEIKDTIPPLNEPVPEHWMKINQDISVFLTSKLPLLNRGMLSHPCATPNDGAIDLLLVRGGHGFTKQLDVFTKVEDATHFNLDFVSF
jgi:sphingosine kinase